MQQPYPTYGQYDRPVAYNNAGYDNVNRIPTEYMPQAAQMYNRPYPMQNYNQGYNYQGYSQPGGGMYNVPAAPGFSAQGINYMNGVGPGRGRGGYYAPVRAEYPGGFRGGRGGFTQKKKPFVGGSLETQKEWERQTGCCFFMEGNCKFGDRCRFVHEENTTLPCKFGENCRVHGARAKGTIADGEEPKKEETEAPMQRNAEAGESP